MVDVGINRVDDPSRERGYRLTGDVDFGPVSEVASAITPVPGGVGPMTIAMVAEEHASVCASRCGGVGGGVPARACRRAGGLASSGTPPQMPPSSTFTGYVVMPGS